MKSTVLVLLMMAAHLTAQEGPAQRFQGTLSLVIGNVTELAATGSIVADSFTEITARLEVALDNSTRSFGDGAARVDGALGRMRLGLSRQLNQDDLNAQVHLALPFYFSDRRSLSLLTLPNAALAVNGEVLGQPVHAGLEGAVSLDGEHHLTLLPYGGKGADDAEKRPHQGFYPIQWGNWE